MSEDSGARPAEVGDFYPHLVTAMRGKSAVCWRRTCRVCLQQWQTREIPLAKSWPKTTRANVCPDCGGPSRVTISVTRQRMDRPGATFASPGLFVVMKAGGVYRRHWCKRKSCGARWTTGEFRADLGIDPQANVCPRCRGLKSKMEEMGLPFR